MKNGNLINSAYTTSSFGHGAYGIEIYKDGKSIVIKDGEPQRLSQKFRINDASEDLIFEMENLSKDFLLEKGVTAQYADQFTHYIKNDKWYSY